MRNELSDEQFDQLLRKLTAGSALDDSAVNDIADSPSMWWGVQRRINAEKGTRSPWPPVRTWKRWLWLAVPTAAAVLLAGVFMANRAPVATNDLAALPISPPQGVASVPNVPSGEPSIEAPPPASMAVAHTKKTVTSSYALARKDRSAIKPSTALGSEKHSEIKTDFIALSYARDPESGQIVRVRVPSSMMVTLGLVASVKQPSQMVDAEVLVGDDGLSRAIRFIR